MIKDVEEIPGTEVPPPYPIQNELREGARKGALAAGESQEAHHHLDRAFVSLRKVNSHDLAGRERQGRVGSEAHRLGGRMRAGTYGRSVGPHGFDDADRLEEVEGVLLLTECLDYRISRVPACAGHRFHISPGRRVLSATSRVNEFTEA